MKRVLSAFPILLGLGFCFVFAYQLRDRALRGQNDFAAFYTGAKLVGTPELYSREANTETIKDLIGFSMDGVTYIRPPYYAVFFKPLTWLPYQTAYGIYVLTLICCMLWFVIRFSKESRELAFFAAFGVPMITPLCNGQDTPLLLAAVGASILLLRRGRDFAAGMVLALCATKFHLFLFVVVLLILKKRWRALGGGAAGIAYLTLLGIAFAGWDSMRQWIEVLRDPWIGPHPEAAPNVHGMVLSFHGNLRWELALAGLVGIAFLWMTRKTENFEFLLAASLVCGLLTSFHSGISDDILLFPVFVLAMGTCSNVVLRSLSAIVLTPFPYFLGFGAGSPYTAAMPLLLIAWLMMAGWALQHRSVFGLKPVGGADSRARFDGRALEMPEVSSY